MFTARYFRAALAPCLSTSELLRKIKIVQRTVVRNHRAHSHRRSTYDIACRSRIDVLGVLPWTVRTVIHPCIVPKLDRSGTTDHHHHHHRLATGPVPVPIPAPSPVTTTGTGTGTGTVTSHHHTQVPHRSR